MLYRVLMLACCFTLLAPGCIPMNAPGAGGSAAATPAQGAAPANSEAAPAPGSEAAPGSGEAPAAAPASVSVSIRSRCPRTVKVFFGEKPKFGSGTSSTVSSNSVSSHSFRPGDFFWLVDDGDNGIGNVQIGPATREIELSESCTGLTTR